MKKVLLFTGIISLLATTGCLVAEGGRRERGRGRYEDHPEIRVAAPVVVVPVVRVRVD